MSNNEEEKGKKNSGNPLGTLNNIDNMAGGKGKDALKDGLNELIGKAGKDAVKEAGKELAKRAAAEVAEDAVGASTAGVGKAVMAAARVAFGAFDPDGHDGGKGLLNIILALAGVMMLLTAIPAMFTGYLSITNNPATEKAMYEKSYDMQTTGEAKRNGTEYIRTNNESLLGAGLKKIFVILTGGEDDIFGELDPYTQDNSMYDGSVRMVNFLKNVLSKAQGQAWRDTMVWMAKNTHTIDGINATTQSYQRNAALYQEVNYAEMIAVISQNEKYSDENITTEALKELFKGKNALRHLYRLEIEKITCTKETLRDEYGIDIIEEFCDIDGNFLYDDKEQEVTWGNVTLRGYYLIDLYKLVDLDGYGSHYRIKSDRNIDLLDRQESVMRRFSDLEGYETDNTLASLYGPYIRTEWDGAPESTYIDDTYESEPDLGSYDITKSDIDITRLKEIITDEEVVLPMGRYLNQGSSDFYGIQRGNGKTTVKSSACCDMSWAMVAEYYTGLTYDITQLESKYVSGKQFQTSTFASDYGLSIGSKDPVNIDAMRSAIKSGRPVILHISGHTSYHHTNNGHFLVLMGYNQNGFYMYDPGSSKNTYQGGQDRYLSYEELLKDSAGRASFYYINPSYNG